jgi:acetate kinase
VDAAERDERARFALDAFTTSVAKSVAALTSVLGGVDLLVFTGGIGARSDVVRAGVARRLAWLGIDLDAAANARNDELLTHSGARVVVLAVETDEESVIARHAWAVTAEERDDRPRP